MNEINWSYIEHFSPNEFSENPELAEPELLYALEKARVAINEPIYPSKATGALARFTGSKTTQHYAVNRLSTACDVFCEGYPIFNFMTILSAKLFNGIGIYLHTNGNDGLPWIMFHLDIRKRNTPLIWIVKNQVTNDDVLTKYFYPQLKPKYWKLLKSGNMYEPRKKIR